MFSGSILTTLLQYAVGVGIVALGCLPVLALEPVRTRLTRWPTDRLTANYLVVATVIAAGQWVVVLVGWPVLHIGSTQADPQFRGGRLIALLVGYPVTMFGVGLVGGWLSDARRWLTPRVIAGLGVTVVFYIVTVLGATLIVFIVVLFTALPT